MCGSCVGFHVGDLAYIVCGSDGLCVGDKVRIVDWDGDCYWVSRLEDGHVALIYPDSLEY